MTNKSFIIRYILLKIILGEYKINQVIPSENKIAEKFKCTRMHVREVYLKLIENNILYSVKGSGYYVSEFALNSIFLPYRFLLNTKLLVDKNIINNIDIINNEGKIIGHIEVNFKIDIFDSFLIKDLLIKIIQNSNFNVSQIFNSFKNNIEINNKIFNKFTTIFYKEDNSSIVINTYLSNDFDIEMFNILKI